MEMKFIKQMKHLIKNTTSQEFFTLCGISVTILGWIGLILTFLGIFHTSILAIFTILLSSFLIYIAIINKKNFKFSQKMLLVLFSSFMAISIFSYFTTPSIFSGRDQGSFSNAAISLSQNHSLKSTFPAEQEFFKIYGPGTALNFPGFSYDKAGNLTPHLASGYIIWLAIFYSLFGLFGFVIANAIAFFLFLISFYAVSRNYLKPSLSLVAFFLVITSFIFSWFFKYTLSENLALGLIWFSILQFIYFLKGKNRFYLFSFLLSFGLLFFVRIETVAFALAIAIILFFQEDRKQLRKILLEKTTLLLLAFIFIFFMVNFKINNAFYVNFAKGFLHSFSFSKSSLSNSYPFEGTFYLIRVLSIYTLINYIILGLVSLFYFIKNKQIKLLIPYLILLPAFFYLINPSITMDHPWMLRRYAFAVLPISILYTVIFLEIFSKKKIYFYILSFFLLLTNLMTFLPYITVKENPTLLPQIKELSSNFGKNDLILIDRSATGDPWSMMSGPMNLLYNKQAVYFFNPSDLEKIDQTKFDKIYLIVPDFNIEFYTKSALNDKMVFVKNYILENNSLNIINGKKNELYKNPVVLPLYQKNYTYGKIYLIKN